MHASDDHKGVGRIPVRAKKSGQGRTDKKKNGQWGIQVGLPWITYISYSFDGQKA